MKIIIRRWCSSGVTNGHVYIEMLIVSFIPEANKYKNMLNSSQGHFIVCLFSSLNLMLQQHHLSAPA